MNIWIVVETTSFRQDLLMVDTDVLWIGCIGNSTRCTISTIEFSPVLLATPSICKYKKFITIDTILYICNGNVSKKHVCEPRLLVFEKTQQ